MGHFMLFLFTTTALVLGSGCGNTRLWQSSGFHDKGSYYHDANTGMDYCKAEPPQPQGAMICKAGKWELRNQNDLQKLQCFGRRHEPMRCADAVAVYESERSS